MTEKRFMIADDYAILDSTQNNEVGNGIYVAQDPVEAIKICKLLNDLADENKELQDFKELWIGQNSILERENKALTESNQELTRKLSAIKIEKINEIIEQNKKLKKQIKELMK